MAIDQLAEGTQAVRSRFRADRGQILAAAPKALLNLKDRRSCDPQPFGMRSQIERAVEADAIRRPIDGLIVAVAGDQSLRGREAHHAQAPKVRHDHRGLGAIQKIGRVVPVSRVGSPSAWRGRVLGEQETVQVPGTNSGEMVNGSYAGTKCRAVACQRQRAHALLDARVSRHPVPTDEPVSERAGVLRPASPPEPQVRRAAR